MRKVTPILIILLIALQAAVQGSAQVNSKPSNGEIIRNINSALYNLPSNGLASFKAKVKVDWSVALGNTADIPAETMKLFNGIWFSVSVSYTHLTLPTNREV